MLTLADHFAPHPSRKFDGYYTRTQTEDGGTIAIIFCRVKGATNGRGNLVFVLYDEPVAGTTPSSSSTQDDHHAAFDSDTDRSLGVPAAAARLAQPTSKYEFYPEHLDVSVGQDAAPGKPQPFTITAPGVGSMTVTATTIEYDICVPEEGFRLHMVLTELTPWSRTHQLQGPMGPILHLSGLLPLNWHVRSVHSAVSYALTLSPPPSPLPAPSTSTGGTALRRRRGPPQKLDVHGTGHAHAEKNWGASFPHGWIWAQAFSADGTRTLCLAGGAALPGVQAFLVGYRSPSSPGREGLEWDFRPPYALGVCGFAPFMRVRRDRARGTVELRVGTWSRRLHVRIEAPPESFVGVTAPLKDGHERDFAHESFKARVTVEAYRRRAWWWWWPWAGWELVEEAILGQTADGVDCGALEFGGSFAEWGIHMMMGMVPRDVDNGVRVAPATVEINDAYFCQHFKEVFDPIDREGLEAPASSQNKDGVYQCKKHGSPTCNQCYGWKKQITRARAAAKKAGKKSS
ncbi:hypothetical protein C8Q70DRAFT_933805 [Cubamyces menziesii]|nr:hypothetical protein C8Q70DRAFT_933805 [Cubamyces menziesii]